MELWDRLDAVADRFDVLRHPFYVRWSEGALTREELSLYAGQYAHAVRALAAASRSAARAMPSTSAAEHAAEEEAHVALWGGFAAAVGSAEPAEPLPETSACARVWGDPEREPLPTVVALYAIESAQPAISETKRAGLVERYGFPPGPATAYFDVHAVRDVEHARAGRDTIAELRRDDADDDALVAEAERVLAANWRLLDGVERACAERRMATT